MPTYQYLCRNCGHQLEEFQSISEPELVSCPECKTDSLARVLGSGAGLIFKGSGFYLTDYVKGKEKGEVKPKETAKTDTKPASTGSDAKSSSSSTSTPPPKTEK